MYIDIDYCEYIFASKRVYSSPMAIRKVYTTAIDIVEIDDGWMVFFTDAAYNNWCKQ